MKQHIVLLRLNIIIEESRKERKDCFKHHLGSEAFFRIKVVNAITGQKIANRAQEARGARNLMNFWAQTAHSLWTRNSLDGNYIGVSFCGIFCLEN
jgi:hypothetical protein